MNLKKFGCQTYSWQMTFDKYAGDVPHILKTTKQAGFNGVEFEVCMLGDYYNNVDLFKEELHKYDLEFAALALPLHWLGTKENDEEFQEAQKAIGFLHQFTESKLILCHLPENDRSELDTRQKNQISCIKDIAERANQKGIVTAFHANSSIGSAFRTKEDYDYLTENLNTSAVWLAPDVGHLVNGGIDALKFIKTNIDRIKHLHFKDIDQDKVWVPMGKGVIDFHKIVSYLKSKEYCEWVMIEEESELAKNNPDNATIENGKYIKNCF